MKVIKVTETIYGFSHYYTLYFSDGSWKHQFHSTKEIEAFLTRGISR